MKSPIKKLLVAFIILGFISGIQSCKKEEDPITPQDQTEDPVAGEFPQPNLVDETTRNAIKELDTANFTFTFSQETDVVKNLEVGSIMVDSSSNLAPYGYLRRVTSINNTKGEITINTEQAQLVDLADTGSIRFRTGKIPQSRVEKIVLSEGVKWVGQKDPNFSVYSFDYTKTYSGSNGEFTVEGHTSLDMDFFFDLDWHWEWELNLTLGHPVVDLFESGVEINQVASIQTVATGAYQLSGEKETLAEFYFTPWTFMVGIFPVVLVPKVELFLQANGEIVAEFTAGASEEFTGRLGTRKRDGHDWEEIAESSYTTDVSAPNMSYAINYNAHIGPKVSLMLYGVVGPHANATAFAELNSTLEEIHGLWDLYFMVGVRAQVGVTVDVVGFGFEYNPGNFILFKDTVLQYNNEPFANRIYIDAPVNESEYAIGDNVNFVCSYTGDTPDAVEFYIGNDMVFEDTEAPYEYSWESLGLNEGLYRLIVKERMDGIVISSDTTEFYLRRLEWSEVDLSNAGVSSNTYLTDIAFLGQDEAWVTAFEGASGKLLKTSNGGLDWTLKTETNYGLMQLKMLGEYNDAAFLTSTNKVHYTGDGGSSISELQYDFYGNLRPTFQWKNVYGLGLNEDSDILAIGKDTGIPYQFEVYRADGESHEPFEDFSLPHPNEYGYSPKIFSKENQVLVYGIQDEDVSGSLFYEISLDGGQNWTDHQFTGLTDNDMLKDASILNDDQWWIAGENASGNALVLISTNGGMSWEKVVLDDINGFESVIFIDSEKGYATVNKTTANPEPKIYQTMDGGHSWEAVFGLNTTQAMKKVIFVGDQQGIAIGQGPVIYKYGLNE